MRHPLTLEAFADWCGKKPAHEEYGYFCSDQCAVGQYAKSIGLTFRITDHIDTGNFWDTADSLAAPSRGELTFGALAARLREAASS